MCRDKGPITQQRQGALDIQCVSTQNRYNQRCNITEPRSTQKLFCLEYLSTNLKTKAVLVHRHNQNEGQKHHPPPEELLSHG
jgi:hypothetical protein